MKKPKIKLMQVGVSFDTARTHVLVEEYCQREFGHDLITQLTKVCERWLANAQEVVLVEEKIKRTMAKDWESDPDPSKN